MQRLNSQVVLRRRPSEIFERDDLEVVVSPVPKLEENCFLVRVDQISIDPAMRGWMSPVRSYIDPVAIGSVMRAFGGGTVIDSKNEAYPIGTRLTGLFGLQEFCISNGLCEGWKVRYVGEAFSFGAALGPLGLPGLTAYFGLFDVARPRASDVLVVSAAAGAVGSAVVQLGLLAGCHVVAIAGGAEKCDWVRSLGAHDVIDYKSDDFRSQLKNCTPKGVDIYFDNVGGEILENTLKRINRGARIALCGGISQYNSRNAVGPSSYLNILGQRATMQGFIYFDYEQLFDAAEGRLQSWYRQGKLRHREQSFEGLTRASEAIDSVLSGKNHGKLLLSVVEKQ